MCLPPLEPPQWWWRPPQSSSLCCAVPELLAHQTAVLSFHHTHCSKRSVRVKRFPFREGVDQPHQLKWMMPVHEWHVSVCLYIGACMSVCVIVMSKHYIQRPTNYYARVLCAYKPFVCWQNECLSFYLVGFIISFSRLCLSRSNKTNNETKKNIFSSVSVNTISID